MVNNLYTANMNDQQRRWFFAEYQNARKEEVVGVLLALFLGGFGIHHFYLNRNGLGILYLLFSWTGIPTILGFIECFLMPRRVAQYNAAQAAYIASGIFASSPAPVPGSAAAPPPAAASSTSLAAHRCAACGQPADPAASFCHYCGAALQTSA